MKASQADAARRLHRERRTSATAVNDGGAAQAWPRHGIQAKLTASSPGDSYEQEADRISVQVMRMPEPGLQPACVCGGACPRCQRAAQRGPGHERVRTKRVEPGELEQTPVPPTVDEALHSTGQPLDRATRAFMEPRFGQDFSRVRVHTGGQASSAAREIGARAFTVGQDIVFGGREYAPDVPAGRELLAHELVHVVQQQPAAGLAPRAGTMLFRQKEKRRESKPKAAACPTLKSFNATKTGTVGMKEMEGRCELMLGNPGKSPGMTFSAQVDIPSGCEGTLQYVQLVDLCRDSRSSKGDRFHIKTDGYWLDKKDPYEEMHFAAPGQVEFKTQDSPGQPEGGIHMTARDKFRMYLLWKPDQPPDAPRIPLSMAAWSWSALADMKPDVSNGCAERWQATKPKAAGGKGKPAKELPTWKKVFPDDRTIEKGSC